jgi:hypothetical protein
MESYSRIDDELFETKKAKTNKTHRKSPKIVVVVDDG